MKKNKPKLLIIYNKIWTYRERIFEMLNEKYDLTVSYIDPVFIDRDYTFKTMYLPVWNIGPFSIHKNNISKIASSFDIVIGLSDIRWLSLMLLGFNPFREYKLLYWGIGVRASYDHSFDAKTKFDAVRFFLTKKADALLFYSNYPVSKYLNAGFSKEQLFVANNTVHAPFDETKNLERNQLLFVGTLYPQKGIELLLEAYKQLKDEGEELLPLKVVGGGEYFEKVNSWIKDNKLSDDIELLGPIYNSTKLEIIFRNSIACISPKQAGLSVLSSMAYGTVFVTKKDAITGGEIFNIIDGVSGLFYDGTIDGLKDKITFIKNNSDKIRIISKKAFEHYRTNRTPDIMAQGIDEAIIYTINK